MNYGGVTLGVTVGVGVTVAEGTGPAALGSNDAANFIAVVLCSPVASGNENVLPTTVQSEPSQFILVNVSFSTVEIAILLSSKATIWV